MANSKGGRFTSGNSITHSRFPTGLGYSGGGITSFSGANYKFVFHLPVGSATAFHYKIEEIQDEIWEIENWLRRNKYSPEERRRLENLITTLKRRQDEYKNMDNNFVPFTPSNIQTLSYQIHADKRAVRSLGHVFPKGYVGGPRLIAGSMIFTVFNEHPLVEMMDTMYSTHDAHRIHATDDRYNSHFLPAISTPDQMPPIHVTILGVNEYGNAATVTLYNVEFLNDGVVLSIQDMLTESTFTFVAEDIDIMRTLDTRGELKLPAMNRYVTVSSLLQTPAMAARRMRRGQPF